MSSTRETIQAFMDELENEKEQARSRSDFGRMSSINGTLSMLIIILDTLIEEYED